MARSENNGLAPQKRGLTWAVSLFGGLILAAILLFRHPSATTTNAGDDVAQDASSGSIMSRIGFTDHKTAAKTADPNAPKLDNVDKQTLQQKSKGAFVGEPAVLGGNLISVDGKPVILWGILSPGQGAYCYTNGKPWACGIESIKATNMAVRSHHLVACFDMGRSDDNRIVGRCYVGIRDVGGELVRAGWALADKDVDGAYLADQSDAKFKKHGLWSSQFSLSDFSGY
ncbi:MAG: thermonuclease family protein [Rudaea sp.]